MLCSNPTIPSILLMTRIDLHIVACMGTLDLRLNSKTCVESMGFSSFVVFENKGYLTHPAPPPPFGFSCAVQWLKLDFCFYNRFMTLQILLPFWIEFNLQDSNTLCYALYFVPSLCFQVIIIALLLPSRNTYLIGVYWWIIHLWFAFTLVLRILLETMCISL